ncbi:MAG: helix-turn-helix transcriptional regulator [Sphaerochaetaceae bacterium]|nr:helix-turn-helix transcriptional regulator [Sphaerochaetaceae bacterium]
MSENNSRKCHKLLLPFIPVVRGLCETLGPDYEIVLHDISGPKHFIVEICNGNLTQRTKDSPMTNFGYSLLNSDEYKDVDYISNYKSFRPDGSPMRSSVIIIRDENRKEIGFLCINYDLTRATIVKSMADFLTNVQQVTSLEKVKETFSSDPREQIRALLDEAKNIKGGVPLRYADKLERREFLDKLDRDGFFSIKGAIEIISEETGKSQFTIYRDLREIRRSRNDSDIS